jgi:hypothetical protein
MMELVGVVLKTNNKRRRSSMAISREAAYDKEGREEHGGGSDLSEATIDSLSRGTL